MKEKKICIWVEDSHLRIAVVTDNLITIYDKDGHTIMEIKNPSKSVKKRIISKMTKKENVSGGNDSGPKENESIR